MAERHLHAHVIEGNDSMSLMIDIYLMGFLSGSTSGAATVFANPNAPQPDDRDQASFAHQLAHKLTDKVAEDPLMRETIRGHINAILFGGIAGTSCHDVHLHPGEGPAPEAGDGS